MIFSSGKVKKHCHFKFGDSKIDVVNEYVYVGIMFSYNTNFYKAIDRQISKAERALYALTTKSRRSLLPIDIIFELFEKMVVPILLYCSEVYGYIDKCIKKLKVFHRALYKRTLKLGKSTPNVMINGEIH